MISFSGDLDPAGHGVRPTDLGVEGNEFGDGPSMLCDNNALGVNIIQKGQTSLLEFGSRNTLQIYNKRVA